MTDHQREIIARMRKEGLGYTAIARAAGLSKESVKGYCRRNNLAGITTEVADAAEAALVAPCACRSCGQSLTQISGRKPRRFCSDKCRVEWWNAHPGEVRQKAVYSFICPTCGKPFTAYGHKERIAFSHFLGYDRGKDGGLVVNAEQAKLVRRIYGLFLTGMSPAMITICK